MTGLKVASRYRATIPSRHLMAFQMQAGRDMCMYQSVCVGVMVCILLPLRLLHTDLPDLLRNDPHVVTRTRDSFLTLPPTFRPPSFASLHPYIFPARLPLLTKPSRGGERDDYTLVGSRGHLGLVGKGCTRTRVG